MAQIKPILLSLLLVITSTIAHSQTKCVITGTVIGRNSQRLLLIKKTQELKNATPIPIIDNRFDFTIIYTDPEAYELTFEDELDAGAWRPITFFPYNGTVNFALHPIDDWNKNVVLGGELNKEYTALIKSKS
jgi:hypothetical protein